MLLPLISPRDQGWLGLVRRHVLHARQHGGSLRKPTISDDWNADPARRRMAELINETAGPAFLSGTNGSGVIPVARVRALAAQFGAAPGFVRAIERELTAAEAADHGVLCSVTVALLLTPDDGRGVPASLTLDLIQDEDAISEEDRCFPVPALAFVGRNELWNAGFHASFAHCRSQGLWPASVQGKACSIMWRVSCRDGADFFSLCDDSGSGALRLALEALLSPTAPVRGHPLPGVAVAARMDADGKFQAVGKLHEKLLGALLPARRGALPSVHTLVLARKQEASFREAFALTQGHFLEGAQVIFTDDFVDASRQLAEHLTKTGRDIPLAQYRELRRRYGANPVPDLMASMLGHIKTSRESGRGGGWVVEVDSTLAAQSIGAAFFYPDAPLTRGYIAAGHAFSDVRPDTVAVALRSIMGQLARLHGLPPLVPPADAELADAFRALLQRVSGCMMAREADEACPAQAIVFCGLDAELLTGADRALLRAAVPPQVPPCVFIIATTRARAARAMFMEVDNCHYHTLRPRPRRFIRYAGAAAGLAGLIFTLGIWWPKPAPARQRTVIVDEFDITPDFSSPKPCYGTSRLTGGQRDLVSSLSNPFDPANPWLDVKLVSASQTRFKIKGMTEKHGYVGMWYSIPPGSGKLTAVTLDVSVIDMVSKATRPYPAFIEIELKNEVPAPPPPPGKPPLSGPNKLIRKTLHRATLWTGITSQTGMTLTAHVPELTAEVTKVILLFNKALVDDSIVLDRLTATFAPP